MKTTLSYVSYFEDLAARATFIDQFYLGYDEFKENADSAEGTIFALEPYENPISENQNDNTLATRTGFFAILKPYDSDLGREYANVIDACEQLCYKVIGQMKRDSRLGTITMDIQNWSGEVAQPIVGNFIGYSIRFNFEESINQFMAYDAEDWNE
jgi:hypothetical protein